MALPWRLIRLPISSKFFHQRYIKNFYPFGLKPLCLWKRNLSHQSNVMHIEEKKQLQDEDIMSFVDKYMNKFRENATSKEGLQKVSADFAPMPIEILKILEGIVKLSEEGKINFFEEEKLGKYTMLMEFLRKEELSRWHLPTLPVLYSHLMTLYQDKNNPIIQKVNSTMMLQMQRAPMNASLMCFILQNQYNCDKELIESSKLFLLDRVSEISTVKAIHRILCNHKYFPDNYLFTVDKILLTLSKTFDGEECVDLLLDYSKSKRRVVFALSTLTQRLTDDDIILTPTQISNILFALAEFRFEDNALFKKIVISLPKKLSEVTDSFLIGSIFRSMGKSRWKNKDLLNSLCNWIENNIDNCRSKDLLFCVNTLAILNHVPINSEQLVNKMVSKIIIGENKTLLIDFVWSLSVLGLANAKLLESALTTNISVAGFENLKLNKTIQKLQNINQIAFHTSSYNGPYLDKSKPIGVFDRKSKVALKRSVLATLQTSYPSPSYLNVKTQNAMGFDIVAELIIDSNGKVLVIKNHASDFLNPFLDKCDSKDFFRIVFFVWDYQDFTQGDSCLLGHNQIAVDIMQQKGYKCIQIPYDEFSKFNKILNRINFINQKIKTSVATTNDEKTLSTS